MSAAAPTIRLRWNRRRSSRKFPTPKGCAAGHRGMIEGSAGRPAEIGPWTLHSPTSTLVNPPLSKRSLWPREGVHDALSSALTLVGLQTLIWDISTLVLAITCKKFDRNSNEGRAINLRSLHRFLFAKTSCSTTWSTTCRLPARRGGREACGLPHLTH